MQYTAFDAHKHYTWARVERPDGTLVREKKIPHEPGGPRAGPARPGARPPPAGGGGNKAARRDAGGLAQRQRAGPLPVVWIPPRELRDARELPRARMALVQQR